MSQNDNKPDINVSEWDWMIRPCDLYKDEYDDCKSIKGKFQQYFVYGETFDCSQWKKDLDNCIKWEKKNDKQAAKEIIQSEQDRKQKRLEAHYNNDVWEKRTSPPADWNKPLPEWMQKENEDSFLAEKASEINSDTPPNVLDNRTLCVIM